MVLGHWKEGAQNKHGPRADKSVLEPLKFFGLTLFPSESVGFFSPCNLLFSLFILGKVEFHLDKK